MLSNANNHLFPFCLRFCCAHETENSLSTRGFIIFRSLIDFFQSPSGEGHLFSTALKEGFILMVAEKGMSGGEGFPNPFCCELSTNGISSLADATFCCYAGCDMGNGKTTSKLMPCNRN